MRIEDFRKLKDRRVAFLSAERHGCSWVCSYISEAYRELSGEDPIYFDYEMSRIIAIDPKYIIPPIHCSVYYVDINWMLKKNWDKIIVFEREYEDWVQAVCRYWMPELPKEKILKKYPKFEAKLKFYHNLVFGNKVDDPRVYYTNLNDLTNYPIDEMNHILEFLEYPMETREWINHECFIRQRPPMFVVKIPEGLRDFDIQGTCINKGHGFDPYQLAMIEHTGIKGLMPIVDETLENNPEATQHGYIKSSGQYINFEYPNCSKLSPEECKFQEECVYRIKPNLMPDILEVLGYI